jgi:hypothetical protein
LLFRFWDPRVLHRYLPLVSQDDLRGWFSDVDAYIVEEPEGQHAARFTLADGKLQSSTVPAFAAAATAGHSTRPRWHPAP